MYEAEIKPATRRFRDWPLAVKSITGFWLLHLVYRALIYALDGQIARMLDPALAVAVVFGIAICFVFCALLAAAVRRGLAAGVTLAAALALPASLMFAAGELAIYYRISPEVNETGVSKTHSDGTVITETASGEVRITPKGESRPTIVKLSPIKERIRDDAMKIATRNATGWYFFLVGLGAFFVGMSSAGRLREAERRAAEFERLAQSAQLRALRYQINPHFLFNTLNSLSSLIMARRPEEAEAMILGLSNFFRSTLAIDPSADVTLAEEIALQQLYLDIERTRFPDRLEVAIDIPDDLGDALVPALLLQPVVENAIKYGVARARGRTRLLIRAERTGEGMRIVVENDGEAGQPVPRQPGTGVGLANVCERLSARFGSAALCDFGPREGGGYRVVMTMPVVRGG